MISENTLCCETFFGVLLLALAVILVGSELLVSGVRTLLTRLATSGLSFGMTMALVRPVAIGTPVLTFYLPVVFITTVALAGVLRTKT